MQNTSVVASSKIVAIILYVVDRNVMSFAPEQFALFLENVCLQSQSLL